MALVDCQGPSKLQRDLLAGTRAVLGGPRRQHYALPQGMVTVSLLGIHSQLKDGSSHIAGKGKSTLFLTCFLLHTPISVISVSKSCGAITSVRPLANFTCQGTRGCVTPGSCKPTAMTGSARWASHHLRQHSSLEAFCLPKRFLMPRHHDDTVPQILVHRSIQIAASLWLCGERAQIVAGAMEGPMQGVIH